MSDKVFTHKCRRHLKSISGDFIDIFLLRKYKSKKKIQDGLRYFQIFHFYDLI